MAKRHTLKAWLYQRAAAHLILWREYSARYIYSKANSIYTTQDSAQMAADDRMADYHMQALAILREAIAEYEAGNPPTLPPMEQPLGNTLVAILEAS